MYLVDKFFLLFVFIFIYNNIQDNNQKQQNFLKIINSGAATQQPIDRFIWKF